MIGRQPCSKHNDRKKHTKGRMDLVEDLVLTDLVVKLDELLRPQLGEQTMT